MAQIFRRVIALFRRRRAPLPRDPFGEPPRETPAAADPFFEGVKASTGSHTGSI